MQLHVEVSLVVSTYNQPLAMPTCDRKCGHKMLRSALRTVPVGSSCNATIHWVTSLGLPHGQSPERAEEPEVAVVCMPLGRHQRLDVARVSRQSSQKLGNARRRGSS